MSDGLSRKGIVEGIMYFANLVLALIPMGVMFLFFYPAQRKGRTGTGLTTTSCLTRQHLSSSELKFSLPFSSPLHTKVNRFTPDQSDAIIDTAKRLRGFPPMKFRKRKVRYLVEVDQLEGKAEILMSAEDLRSAVEEILKDENLRCVNYFADGMPIQKYLECGQLIKQRLDKLFE